MLVPTRELCQQVYSEVTSLLEHCGGPWKAVQLTSGMSTPSLVFYFFCNNHIVIFMSQESHSELNGLSWQNAALGGAPDILISTPACIAMCVREKIIKVALWQEKLSTMVLDEVNVDSFLFNFGVQCHIWNLYKLRRDALVWNAFPFHSMYLCVYVYRRSYKMTGTCFWAKKEFQSLGLSFIHSWYFLYMAVFCI